MELFDKIAIKLRHFLWIMNELIIITIRCSGETLWILWLLLQNCRGLKSSRKVLRFRTELRSLALTRSFLPLFKKLFFFFDILLLQTTFSWFFIVEQNSTLCHVLIHFGIASLCHLDLNCIWDLSFPIIRLYGLEYCLPTYCRVLLQLIMKQQCT